MFSFFKKVKHQAREFDYRPRFYDEQKDALKARVSQRERMKQANTNLDNEESSKSRIADHFETYRRTKKKSQGLKLFNAGTLRVLIVLFAILVFAYFALDRWMPQLMKFWFPEEIDSY